ncbi:hypothetical protein [Streptomyces sp. NPDC048340]|uniref:hypothetical protein n=1 Tax=Streptomyces sp. NPDC048340 TaxID=3365537 RepID=UPI003713DEB7
MTRTTPERPVDIETLFPALSTYRRTGTRLHPRQGGAKHHESSIAGPFLWPAAEPWPMCHSIHPKGYGHRLADVRHERRILDEAWARDPQHGLSDEERAVLSGLQPGLHAPEVKDSDPIPLLAIAQLFTRDIPDLTGPEDRDLLQVFWCPFEVHGEEQALDVVLKWRRSQDVTELLTDTPEPVIVGRKECVPNACILHPEQVVEHEYEGLLSDELQESISSWEEGLFDDEEEGGENGLDYRSDLSIPPGWKVGGFASWHLTDPAPIECYCSSPMSPLLTVHNREWDRGTLSWVPLEDRSAAETIGANNPVGVYVGRGLMRIFVCQANPRHPHRLSFQ